MAQEQDQELVGGFIIQQAVAIVGASQDAAEKPGVFQESVLSDTEPEDVQIFDEENRDGAGVALGEGVNLPQVRDEPCEVGNPLGLADTAVIKICLTSQVVIEGFLNCGRVPVSDGVAVKNPLGFNDIEASRAPGKVVNLGE